MHLAARFAPKLDAEQLKDEYEDFQLLADGATVLEEDGHIWSEMILMKTLLHATVSKGDGSSVISPTQQC